MSQSFVEISGSPDVRGHNQRAILRAIFQQGTTSRASLSRLLGISKPAISENLSPFFASGLVEEVGEGASGEGGGRRPKMLRINFHHRYIIAIDLNRTELVFALGDLNNEIMETLSIPSPADTRMETYIETVNQGVWQLLDRRSLTRQDLVFISFASPGVYDSDGNPLGCNPKYAGAPWASINLCEAMRERFQVDSMAINDINAAALGERMLSGDPRMDNMLYISCGLGFGAGLILDGQLYAGRHFAAGEIYNYVDTDHIARSVGIEEDICTKGLIRRVREAVSAEGAPGFPPPERIRFSDVVDAYRKRDALVTRIVREVCEAIAMVAFNFASLLDVETVVFGGDYLPFGPTMLEEMDRLLGRCSLIAPEISLASVSQHAGIHGLLHAAREKYFDDLCQKANRREVLMA
ncbi:ROK family protein [Bacillota bacterium Meth-B3]